MPNTIYSIAGIVANRAVVIITVYAIKEYCVWIEQTNATVELNYITADQNKVLNDQIQQKREVVKTQLERCKKVTQ